MNSFEDDIDVPLISRARVATIDTTLEEAVQSIHVRLEGLGDVLRAHPNVRDPRHYEAINMVAALNHKLHLIKSAKEAFHDAFEVDDILQKAQHLRVSESR